MRKSSKLPAIIGGLFIIAAGIAVFMVLKGVSNDVYVMTAKKNLPAYSYVDSSDLNTTAVPEASVTSNDLTESEFNAKPGKKFVLTSPILQGQRIDKRDIPTGKSGSFAVVLPDERVVAATSTVAGVAMGTIQAGDVVDATLGGTGVTGAGDSVSSFDKVLCVASDPTDCEGVLPPGSQLNIASNNTTTTGTTTPVTILLAVPETDAASVSGQEVNLSLDPFCRVDSEGYFYSPRSDQGAQFLCQVPSDRLAAKPPASDTQTSSQAG